VRVIERPASTGGLVSQLLWDCRFHAIFADEQRDVRLAAAEIDAGLEALGATGPIDRVEVAVPLFYRGKGAYLVGRVFAGHVEMPLALAMHHGPHGVTVGAALLTDDDLSVLFSYTQSAFHVEVDRPGELVGFLSAVMPRKRRSELYNAIGFTKHAKTELYRDLMGHVATTDERFEIAPGIAGLVMIVFTIPDYDVVFKVIRDRFPYPKQTTRRQIMSKYRLVFRHDRAGRLIDASEFEHLRFPRDRFDGPLLDELAREATKSVEIGDRDVVIHHVYIERKVIPLDLYVRQSNSIKARAAILDYGRAIKNLAASNIFPGDMLLKNFGVTRSGRVVFYDYDELMLLTDCRFREIPDTDDPLDNMSADPWFGVGENDIFPEEFRRFMGIEDDLREAFEERHGDLFGVRFWQRVQDRLRAGEIIEIFPYKRTRRLRSGSTASLR
jgi:isocitrate dehydrogenase kinase/phosphatase